MHKKELIKLYYIFIDNLFAPFLIGAKYYDDVNLILPFNTTVTNMEEKRKCSCFYYRAASFLKLSLEQDNYNDLLRKNMMNGSKDKLIEYMKNYIHDEKYSRIFYKKLGQYLNKYYTFDTILKGCLDIKSSIASRAKRNATQHKPTTTYEQSISEASYLTYSSFTVPYKSSTIYSQSTNTPSVNTESAIKTDYTVPLIMLAPLFILFCCITSMVMKCCSYISKRRARDCRMADDGNKLLPSVSFSSDVQFRGKKTCDENQL